MVATYEMGTPVAAGQLDDNVITPLRELILNQVDDALEARGVRRGAALLVAVPAIVCHAAAAEKRCLSPSINALPIRTT